jgi:hypothetical protein
MTESIYARETLFIKRGNPIPMRTPPDIGSAIDKNLVR